AETTCPSFSPLVCGLRRAGSYDIPCINVPSPPVLRLFCLFATSGGTSTLLNSLFQFNAKPRTECTNDFCPKP
ncbi:hypothetical protein M404DRAFT_1004018, partial [Pisolithus tinctorius Marx 270]